MSSHFTSTLKIEEWLYLFSVFFFFSFLKQISICFRIFENFVSEQSCFYAVIF